MFSRHFSWFRLLLVCGEKCSDEHILPENYSINGVIFSSYLDLFVNNYFFFVVSFLLLNDDFFSISFTFFSTSSAWGTWKASETITAIGTASSTQKNHIIVPKSIIHINTTSGLTPRVFHIKTGTRNFSSDCCIMK